MPSEMPPGKPGGAPGAHARPGCAASPACLADHGCRPLSLYLPPSKPATLDSGSEKPRLAPAELLGLHHLRPFFLSFLLKMLIADFH